MDLEDNCMESDSLIPKAGCVTLRDITNQSHENNINQKPKQERRGRPSLKNLTVNLQDQVCSKQFKNMADCTVRLKIEKFDSIKSSSVKQVAKLPKQKLRKLFNVHDFVSFADKVGKYLCAHNSLDSTITNELEHLSNPAALSNEWSRMPSADLFHNYPHITRHPFLHLWEADEDRPNGGCWRQRKSLYSDVLGDIDPKILYRDQQTESDEVSLPLKRRRKSMKVADDDVAEPEVKDLKKERLLTLFRPELTGYRVNENGGKDALFFWR